MLECFKLDNRGVSKVVGVVLLVGITVLLVAAVLVITTNMANQTPTKAEVEVQQSAFSFEYTDDTMWDPASDTPGEGKLSTFNGETLDTCDYSNCEAFYSDILTMTYSGGQSIDSDNIDIQMTGSGTGFKCTDDSNELDPACDDAGGTHASSATFADVCDCSELGAGDSVRIITILDDVYTARPVSAEMDIATVQLVWESDSGESSTVLAEWEGPDA